MNESDEQRERARAAREGLVGRTVAGRYVLRKLLGHGGMGAVYEAEHVGLGKKVAIKFVDPEFATDEQVVARFAREARAMSAVESAHIVTIFDAGTEDGRPYLVMELLRGEDLGQRLRRLRRIPLPEAMHVTAQVLKGLARAHAAGIVHRDLKPDNVFLTKHDTDPLFAKIVDFGISKIDRPRAGTTPLALTGRGTVLGTPFYMAPEQAQASADVDPRADLYSVGAILFECLSGRPPHTGESYEQVILSICMKNAPDLRAVEPKVPENVSAFVARALARQKEQRFASAERMLAALHEIAPEERTRVPLDPPAPKTLLSAGVDPELSRPEPPFVPSAATRVGVASLSAPETEPTPPPAMSAKPAPVSERAAETRPEGRRTPNAAKPRPAVAAPASPPPKRSLALVLATAVAATLTGVGVTFGVIAVLGDKSARGPAVPTSTTSVSISMPLASPSAASSDASVEPAASATAPSSVAPVVTSPPSSAAPVVTNAKLPQLPASRAPKPTATKPLDIQRDLP